jgi:hypothetical protein
MGSNVIEQPRSQPGTECLEQEAEALRFPGTGQLICYWGALVLLTAASVYLIHLQFAHPGRCVQPANDPFGIVTPPWLMLPVPPLGAIGSLGQAFWQAIRGRQCWKWILAAVAFGGLLASGELLGTCV